MAAGTPPHIPTDANRAIVSALTAYGIPQGEIATYMGLGERTIRRHYKRELATGHLKANSEVAQFLYTSASGRALNLQGSTATHADCIRAAMFWLKTRGRWRETDNLDKPGDDVAEVLRKLAGTLPR